MASTTCRLKVGEKSYTFVPQEMLTVGPMRQIKQWYGSELGTYNGFVSALFMGDPEAALCAVWIARNAAGEDNVPEPNNLADFPLASWLEIVSTDDEAEEGKPTQEAPPITDSEKTSQSSEDATSEF
jgi:hypothetical protein